MDPFDWLIVGSSAMILFGIAVGLWLRWQSAQLDRRFGRDP